MENKDICSICLDNYHNKLDLKCKHSFCKKCITIWLKINNKCPLCNKLTFIYTCEVYDQLIDTCEVYVIFYNEPYDQLIDKLNSSGKYKSLEMIYKWNSKII